MPDVPLNVWAVIGAGVAKFVIGGIWYSQWCFQKSWMKYSGVKPAQMKQGALNAMLVELVGCFIMAYVLGNAVKYASVHTVADGLKLGFCVWGGFVATVTVGAVVFEKKSWQWFCLLNGFQLISLMAMSVILAVWG